MKCRSFCCRPWRQGNGWLLSLQATVKRILSRIILVFFAVLTFMQILISASLASAASMAKVLQAPLQARPSFASSCVDQWAAGVCCKRQLALPGRPTHAHPLHWKKATRCSAWAQETGTGKQSLASVHVSGCWCALLGQGMLLKHSVIKGLTTLLC